MLPTPTAGLPSAPVEGASWSGEALQTPRSAPLPLSAVTEDQCLVAIPFTPRPLTDREAAVAGGGQSVRVCRLSQTADRARSDARDSDFLVGPPGYCSVGLSWCPSGSDEQCGRGSYDAGPGDEGGQYVLCLVWRRLSQQAAGAAALDAAFKMELAAVAARPAERVACRITQDLGAADVGLRATLQQPSSARVPTAVWLSARSLAVQVDGKTVLVLDTVTGGDAERLYQRAGWQRVGEIPNYALMPDGALCSTTCFHRQLAAASP